MTFSARRLAGVLAAATLAAWTSAFAAHQQPGQPDYGGQWLAVDLSPQGWAELRDARPGLPFMKVEWLLGIRAENAWPSKIVVHSSFVQRGRVTRTGQRAMELKESTGFVRLGSLPLGDLVPDDTNIGKAQVVPAGRSVACASGEHLRLNAALFPNVDLRRFDALFVTVDPGDPKLRESAAVRSLLVYFPALDGASK